MIIKHDPLPVERLMMRECPYSTENQDVLEKHPQSQRVFKGGGKSRFGGARIHWPPVHLMETVNKFLAGGGTSPKHFHRLWCCGRSSLMRLVWFRLGREEGHGCSGAQAPLPPNPRLSGVP